jgi:hypothetical protein
MAWPVFLLPISTPHKCWGYHVMYYNSTTLTYAIKVLISCIAQFQKMFPTERIWCISLLTSFEVMVGKRNEYLYLFHKNAQHVRQAFLAALGWFAHGGRICSTNDVTSDKPDDWSRWYKWYTLDWTKDNAQFLLHALILRMYPDFMHQGIPLDKASNVRATVCKKNTNFQRLRIVIPCCVSQKSPSPQLWSRLLWVAHSEMYILWSSGALK